MFRNQQMCVAQIQEGIHKCTGSYLQMNPIQGCICDIKTYLYNFFIFWQISLYLFVNLIHACETLT